MACDIFCCCQFHVNTKLLSTKVFGGKLVPYNPLQMPFHFIYFLVEDHLRDFLQQTFASQSKIIWEIISCDIENIFLFVIPEIKLNMDFGLIKRIFINYIVKHDR